MKFHFRLTPTSFVWSVCMMLDRRRCRELQLVYSTPNFHSFSRLQYTKFCGFKFLWWLTKFIKYHNKHSHLLHVLLPCSDGVSCSICDAFIVLPPPPPTHPPPQPCVRVVGAFVCVCVCVYPVGVKVYAKFGLIVSIRLQDIKKNDNQMP